MPALQYLKNVSTLSLDSARCNKCGVCMKVCPQNVFERTPDKTVVIRDLNRCMECGACQRNCESGAIAVQAGVGCAAAIISSVFSKNGQGTCDC